MLIPAAGNPGATDPASFLIGYAQALKENIRQEKWRRSRCLFAEPSLNLLISKKR
jgi:hypothetical protein